MKSEVIDILDNIIKNQPKLCETAKSNSNITIPSKNAVGTICATEIFEIQSYGAEKHKKMRETDIDTAFLNIKEIISYIGTLRAADAAKALADAPMIEGKNVVDVEKLKEYKNFKTKGESLTKEESKIYADAKKCLAEVQNEKVDTEKSEDKAGDGGEVQQDKETTWKYDFSVLDKYSFKSGKLITWKDFSTNLLAKGVSAIENAEFNLYTMGPKLLLKLIKGASTGLALFRSSREWLKKMKREEAIKKVDKCIKEIEIAKKKNGIPE